jgi:hypothetical protein
MRLNTMSKRPPIKSRNRKRSSRRQAVEVSTFTPKIEKPDNTTAENVATPKGAPTTEELDEEEREFRALRRDLPGVRGASAAGIVSIGVAKIPGKNEFFRTHPTFRPVIPIVDLEVGMERQYFAVTDPMVEALAGIGITVTDHMLYFTITARGAYKIVPVRQAGTDGEQNEYARTKEIGLIDGIDDWVRLYTDLENRCYKVFPAPVGRFTAPVWPELGQDLPPGISRQGPADRQHRARAVPEMGRA